MTFIHSFIHSFPPAPEKQTLLASSAQLMSGMEVFHWGALPALRLRPHGAPTSLRLSGGPGHRSHFYVCGLVATSF